MELKEIKCSHCGKLLLEATGEVKKKCPNCKMFTHVVVTSLGIINLEKIEIKHFIQVSK